MLFIYLYIWSIKAKAKLADIKKGIMKKKKKTHIYSLCKRFCKHHAP